MKYVLLKQQNDLVPVIAVGFAPQPHTAIAEPYRARGYAPISAGFVRIAPDGTLAAFGRSESLNLEAAPSDTRLLNALHRATLSLAPV